MASPDDFPIGVPHWPGIAQVLSCTATLQHGVTPSAFTLSIAPQPAETIQATGTLTLTYGSEKIEFIDCMIDLGKLTANDSGQIVSLTILDRRWKWRKCGEISGAYNLREKDGKLLKNAQADAGSGNAITNAERTPKQLAELLFEAMGETDYILDDMPNDARPTVEWDLDNPAKALGDLCEELGCRVVLQLDNKIAIRRTNVGKELPTENVLTFGLTLNPADVPFKLGVASGKARLQYDFELEAVAKDLDGKFKLLKDLKLRYGNDAGTGTPIVDEEWSDIDLPYFARMVKSLGANGNIDYNNRTELAKKYVFKAYRIKIPEGGITLPGYPHKITRLEQILPVESVQVETIEDEDKTKKSLEAMVYGVWLHGQDTNANVAEKVTPVTNVKTDPQIYRRDFRIDEQRGIVLFSDYVVRNTVAAAAGETSPASISKAAAQLRLRCAVSVRDAKTRGWFRHQIERETGSSVQTKTEWIKRDEIIPTAYASLSESFSVENITNNKEEIEKEMNYYLDARMAEYTSLNPAEVEYGGLLAIELDGAIQSVSWEIGSGGTKTTVQRNQDKGSPTTVPYKIKRANEKSVSLASKPPAKSVVEGGVGQGAPYMMPGTRGF